MTRALLVAVLIARLYAGDVLSQDDQRRAVGARLPRQARAGEGDGALHGVRVSDAVRVLDGKLLPAWAPYDATRREFTHL